MMLWRPSSSTMWRTGFSDSSWKSAKLFFEVNPDVSAAHLLGVLRVCMDYFGGEMKDGFDPDFCVKSAKHLTSFFKHLERIITTVEMVDALPPLSYPELGKQTD